MNSKEQERLLRVFRLRWQEEGLSEKGEAPMITEPKLEDRSAQPYVALRTQATMQELDTVIPQRLGEVFAWLGKQGIAPAGAPFIRYLVIDMDALLDSELGVPVATALSGDG